jgi:YbbR domain-containing protein
MPIAVTMRGPRTILEGVDEQKERITLDMSGVTTTEPPVELKAEMLRPDLPRRLKVIRFEPARLKLRIERRVRRRLPVKVSLDGPPGVGYMLGEPTVTPELIEVSGPASKVEEQKEITTESINVSGITETVQRPALLAWAGNFMTFAPDRVMVTIPVKLVMVSRPFDGVPVTIRNADGIEARVTPPRIDITVRGPQLTLNNYKVEPGQVWIDAAGLGVGRHDVPVQVDVPAGVELTRRRPEMVTLHVMSGDAR